MMSIADNATLTVPERLGEAGLISGRRRDRLAPGPDRQPGDQDPRSRICRSRPVRRQPAEGRHGPGAGRRPPAAGADHPDRRAWTCAPRSSCSARSRRPRDTGTGVLIASDELDDLRMCDRVLVMFQGRVVAEIAARLARPRRRGRDGRSGPRCLRPPSRTRHGRAPPSRAGNGRAVGGRIRWPGCATSRSIPAIIVIAIVGQIVNPVFLQTRQPDQRPADDVRDRAAGAGPDDGPGRRKMDLSLESTFGLAPGVAAWLTVADRRRPRARAAVRRLGDPGHPGRRRAHRRGQRPADRPLRAQRLHRHPRHADRAARRAHRHLRRPDLLPPAAVDALPRHRPVVRRARLDLALPAAVRRRHRACSAAPASAAPSTPSAATSTRPRRPASAPTGCCGPSWSAPACSPRSAGLLLSGRLASVAAAQGNGDIFTVFAAAVIGGISLNGGKGTMFGAFTGILLLYMIQNVLTLAGVPAQWIGALNGADHPHRAHRLPHHRRQSPGITRPKYPFSVPRRGTPQCHTPYRLERSCPTRIT